MNFATGVITIILILILGVLGKIVVLLEQNKDEE